MQVSLFFIFSIIFSIFCSQVRDINATLTVKGNKPLNFVFPRNIQVHEVIKEFAKASLKFDGTGWNANVIWLKNNGDVLRLSNPNGDLLPHCGPNVWNVFLNTASALMDIQTTVEFKEIAEQTQ